MISSLRSGGSERQSLLLLQHLDRTKFEPHLYLTERKGELLTLVPADVVIHSYADDQPPGGLYFPGRALRDQTRHLTRVLKQEAIDVVYDRTFQMSLIAGPACIAVAIPRISTIVSPPELALPLVESRFIELKRRRLAAAYQASRTVVAVSDAVAESAKRFYGLSTDNIQVIRSGVDIDAIATVVRSESVTRDRQWTLACVGRMTPEKGHRDLIDAVARCEQNWPIDAPPIRLWMIGSGPFAPNWSNELPESVIDTRSNFSVS